MVNTNGNTTKLQAGIEEHLDTGNIGHTGKHVIVTKAGEEGGFEIDAFTGIVLDTHNLPEWAAGTTQALLAERHIFYTSRLGSLYVEDMKQPDTLAYEDLSWVTATDLEEPVVNEETGLPEHVELNVVDADHEFRMAIIAEVTGIAGDIDLEEGTFGADAVTEAIARDNMRDAEELAAMDEAAKEGFKAVSTN